MNNNFIGNQNQSPQFIYQQQPAFDPSQVDPSHFQMLYEQMQNNQEFLAKMQELLAAQNFGVITESSRDENNSFNQQPQITGGALIEEDLQYQKTIFDALSTFQSQISSGEGNINLIPSQTYQYDPTMQLMLNQQQQISQVEQEQSSQGEQVQSMPEGISQEGFIDQMSQMMNGAGGDMVNPEYMQMFNQFYQLFTQLQTLQAQSPQSDANDLLSNETFIQNLMLAFFQQQQQQQINFDCPQSPRMNQYNKNLPLASIPETKESILEENSAWNTVKSNKVGLMMSAGSTFGKDGGCSCCNTCQDFKRRGIQQYCSNFNPGIQPGMCQNNTNYLQLSSQCPEPFYPGSVQGSTVQSAAKQQLINGAYQLGSFPSSPQNPFGFNHINYLSALQVNQNLNQVFQLQRASDDKSKAVILEPSHNNSKIMDQVQSKIQTVLQSPQQKELKSQVMSPTFSKTKLQGEGILSPKQIQETKLIEYMLENDDFSNYKQRRQAINGERMCRTLSRGANMSHCGYVVAQSNNFNTLFNQSQQNQYQAEENQQQQEFFSAMKSQHASNAELRGGQDNFLDNYNKEFMQFFSPQVPSRTNQGFTKKQSVQERLNDINRACSPDILAFSEQQSTRGTQKRKKTQEKIKEIRKINEMREAKQLLKKSQTKGKLNTLKTQKQVFEIKDLKKSVHRKQSHVRKQSYNIQGNKENQKLLLQSNIHKNYEISQENIVMSPSQDLLTPNQLEEVQTAGSRLKRDPNTFKSLSSVWNSRVQNLSQNQEEESGTPLMTNLKLRLDNKKSSHALFNDLTNSSSNQQVQPILRNESIDLNALLSCEKAENKKPGQEIHIIKKPVQTEESKKIQERLNKYYQSKRKEENTQKNVQTKQEQQRLQQQQAQQQQQQQHDNETLSMTKTLSSFKSLMMKTMSQMSVQQDQNLCQQYAQGKDQRSKAGRNQNNQAQGTNYNPSMNVSSIQDDNSYVGEFSENLSKMISPKNLYNGSYANIKYRNPQVLNDRSLTPKRNEQIDTLKKEHQNQLHKQQSCLPNSLFFKQLGIKGTGGEDTLSLKYNSRQPSLCFCGKVNCNCDQNSKKDLLGHFQNFLSEMDKHNIKTGNKGSCMSSPIQKIATSNTTQDFLLSNFQMIGNMGRSSSQNSRFNTNNGYGGKRQSSIGPQVNMIQSSHHRMKRFSSSSQLPNIPLKKTTHCQSTLQFNNNVPNLLNPYGDSSNDSKNMKAPKQVKIEVEKENDLEKLDTNKEEEIRLASIENDIMHKAFIQKSHRLNLQDSQREELLLRIQRHKQELAGTKNNSVAGQDNEVSNNCVATTQNTSHFTGYDKRSFTSGQQPPKLKVKSETNNHSISSLEERRLIEKYKKKVECIKEMQNERRQEIEEQQQQLDFY